MISFLLISFSILVISTLVTYIVFNPIIKASKPSDDKIRNENLLHEMWRNNQQSQGLVLDMDAYTEGKEVWISKEEAELKNRISIRLNKFTDTHFSSLKKLLVAIGVLS